MQRVTALIKDVLNGAIQAGRINGVCQEAEGLPLPLEAMRAFAALPINMEGINVSKSPHVIYNESETS